MERKLVGILESLWRYPVKSMQGEQLESSDISTKGLLGDRAFGHSPCAACDPRVMRPCPRPHSFAKLATSKVNYFQYL